MEHAQTTYIDDLFNSMLKYSQRADGSISLWCFQSWRICL